MGANRPGVLFSSHRSAELGQRDNGVGTAAAALLQAGGRGDVRLPPGATGSNLEALRAHRYSGNGGALRAREPWLS